MRADGTLGAIGVALNEENPVFPDDAPKRMAWNAAWFQRVVTAAVKASGPPIDYVLAAGVYTLLNQAALDDNLLGMAQGFGVAVLAAAPFNSGILARARDNFEGATYSYTPADAAVIQRAKDLAEVCERHGVALRAAALAFPLAHPAVASVVVGAKSPEEWRDCVALLAQAKEAPAAFWAELRERHLIHGDAPVPSGKST
eukprot:m.27831 g.27831  ORF g.27831 m.27831 type:complete len:200 (-) comp4457_c0_seq2:99-698(-)